MKKNNYNAHIGSEKKIYNKLYIYFREKKKSKRRKQREKVRMKEKIKEKKNEIDKERVL